jgi:hypothetical protein
VPTHRLGSITFKRTVFCSVTWQCSDKGKMFRRGKLPPSSGLNSDVKNKPIRECVFCDVTKRGPSKNRRFGGTQRFFHHQGGKNRSHRRENLKSYKPLTGCDVPPKRRAPHSNECQAQNRPETSRSSAGRSCDAVPSRDWQRR